LVQSEANKIVSIIQTIESDSEDLKKDEEIFFSTFKKVEKYLEMQLEVQKNDLGKALD
jgi:hypothetical protein